MHVLSSNYQSIFFFTNWPVARRKCRMIATVSACHIAVQLPGLIVAFERCEGAFQVGTYSITYFVGAVLWRYLV